MTRMILYVCLSLLFQNFWKERVANSPKRKIYSSDALRENVTKIFA